MSKPSTITPHDGQEPVSGNSIDGVMYQMAHRWWGKIILDDEGKEPVQIELDVVAESFDKKHILIGECKWTAQEDAARLISRLRRIAPRLPFAGNHQLHYCLFLRKKPVHSEAARLFYPEDVLDSLS